LLGLLLFLVLLWKCFRLSFRLFRIANDPFFRALGLGAAAYVVCAFVVNFFGDRWMYLQVNGYLWTFLGLVVRAHMLTEEEHSAESEAEPPHEESKPEQLPALAPA